MDLLKSFLLIIIYNLILISCSTSKSQLSDYAEQVDIVGVEAWLNLMPGGPGSFHLTGEYESMNDFILKSKLTTIKVYSDSELIYEIKSENINCELQIGQDIQALRNRFNIRGGLKLNERIQTTEKLDVKLIFELNGDLFEKDVNDIFLTRAY